MFYTLILYLQDTFRCCLVDFKIRKVFLKCLIRSRKQISKVFRKKVNMRKKHNRIFKILKTNIIKLYFIWSVWNNSKDSIDCRVADAFSFLDISDRSDFAYLSATNWCKVTVECFADIKIT